MNFQGFSFKGYSLPLSKAVVLAFDKMPPLFDGVQFLKEVRKHIGEKKPYDATIFRVLIYQRESGKLNYKVIDQQKSKYKKLC